MTTTMNQLYEESLNLLTGDELDRHWAVWVAGHDRRGLKIRFFDQAYFVAPGKIEDIDGRPPTDAVGLVLCRYLLHPPPQTAQGDRQLTFRDLDGAGPLVSSFTDNTNKIIAGTFGTRLKDLETIALDMGARPAPDGSHFDLYFKFDALPGVPIFLQFNAADDLFPPQCTLLFNQSAQTCLDMQSLFILATYLTGRLINGGDA